MLGRMLVPFTLDEYYQELGARLTADTTVILVDTNILAYPYRLFRGARRELLDWFSRISDKKRLYVPAWAASEYFARTCRANLKEFLPELDSRTLLAQLDKHLQLARLALDDNASKGRAANREELIRNLEDAITKLRPHLEALTINRDQVPDIHAEVEETFGLCILESDIARLCAEVSSVADHRILHRLPPGFQDSGKKVNTWGDLILWREILEFASSKLHLFKNFVFITNDEKLDWSYAPQHRKRLSSKGKDGKENNSNPEIRLTDPRLLQEFRARFGTQFDFEVVSVGHVIASLSRAEPERFRLLSMAFQVQVVQAAAQVATEGPAPDSPGSEAAGAERLAVIVTSSVGQTATNGPDVGVVGQIAGPEGTTASPGGFVITDKALADEQYVIEEASSPVDEIIEKLRSHNWYTQNPAVNRIANLASGTYSADAWFVLGRNVYQAACGTAKEAIKYLKHLRERLEALPPEAASAMFAGMLFEVYFNGKGNLRSGTFKIAYLDELVPITQEARYRSALQFVNRHLEPHRSLIAAEPDKFQPVAVVVNAERITNSDNRKYWELRDLLIGGRSALNSDEAGDHDHALRGDEIRRWLAKTYALPPRGLDVAFEPPEASDSMIYLPDDEDKILAPAAALFGETK